MPIDTKYGRVTLENPRSVADDEVVVVFVAHDRLLPKLLKVYHILCELAGSPPNHLRGIDAAAANVKAWQAENFTQTPQSKGFDPA